MRFWGRKEERATRVEGASTPPECSHSTLAPRWDSAADMGKADRVPRYECASCHQRFDREEGERMMSAHNARSQGMLGAKVRRDEPEAGEPPG